MSPPDDEDRASILARRAAFITSALSLLHCSPASERPTSSPAATVSSAEATPSPSDTARPVAGLRSFADALVGAPPRGAPATLPDGIRGEAQALEQTLDRLYGGVEAAWKPRPGLCDAADPSCKEGWRALGQDLSKLRDEVNDLRGSMCGNSIGELGTLARRRNVHRMFLEALLDEVDDRYARIAASMSARGEQEWLKIAANAKVTPPMPCLKCAPPPRLTLADDVLFEDASATLDEKSEARLGRMLADFQHDRGQRIELIGHADPGERGDLTMLSQKRAEVIASWLAAKGVPQHSIRVLGLGAMLPVSKDARENRRVESALLRER